jgi:DNA polymerase-4
MRGKAIIFYAGNDQVQNLELIESTIDDIRRRFGHYSVHRGLMLNDRQLSHINPKDDHVIHPVAFNR